MFFLLEGISSRRMDPINLLIGGLYRVSPWRSLFSMIQGLQRNLLRFRRAVSLSGPRCASQSMIDNFIKIPSDFYCKYNSYIVFLGIFGYSLGARKFIACRTAKLLLRVYLLRTCEQKPWKKRRQFGRSGRSR